MVLPMPFWGDEEPKLVYPEDIPAGTLVYEKLDTSKPFAKVVDTPAPSSDPAKSRRQYHVLNGDKRGAVTRAGLPPGSFIFVTPPPPKPKEYPKVEDKKWDI